MNIHGLKKKKKKVTQHLNKIRDKKVSKSHMDEQESARSNINRKIRTIKMERKKKHANK